LLNIINDILDIAKIESGQMSINYEECNIIDLFNELIPVVADYKKRIGKEHLKTGFKCDLPGFTIRTDKGKLKQVFINLLTNAIKFTSEGYVEGGCKMLEDNTVWFYVSDTGIGIPEEKHHEIFERFVQLNASYSEGTGLGLSIVKGLIDRMGGRIIIRSEPQKGSTFLFQVENNPPQR
jgi:signal transduction histidine kinase